MLSSVFPNDDINNFAKSVSNYLKNHSYSSTVSRDLFAFLEPPLKDSGLIKEDENLADFIEPWINRSGFPLVSFTRNETDNTVGQPKSFREVLR